MNALIVGGGRIGLAIAEALLAEGHDVTVVEKSSAVAEKLRDSLPAAEVVHGDGDEPVVLEQARIMHAQVVAAVTDEDEDNLVTCLLAKREYAVGRTFARVNTATNEWLFGERFGVDEWLSAERIEPADVARRMGDGV